jgi:hypothetical protein
MEQNVTIQVYFLLLLIEKLEKQIEEGDKITQV